MGVYLGALLFVVGFARWPGCPPHQVVPAAAAAAGTAAAVAVPWCRLVYTVEYH